MKTGKSLVELAQELMNIKSNSRDFVVPINRMAMDVHQNVPVLVLKNGDDQNFTPSPWAHSQISTLAEVPSAYYNRLALENPALLADNVNHGFGRLKPDTNRMIRTVNGNLRAVVSSKYRRLDSYDLVDAVFPAMIENKLQVVSSDLTDRRLYIKALSLRGEMTADIRKGDAVQFGLAISSSDVGCGAVRVEPLIVRLICLNGAIMESAIKRMHIGRDLADGSVFELLSEATQNLTDAAFWAQVRDVVVNSLNPAYFEAQVAKFRAAADRQITNFDLPEVVELTAKQLGITGEKTKQSALAYLANGGDGAGLNAWGLMNAFTYAAQQPHLSYDDSVDLERSATKIIELGPRDWKRIAEAA